MKNILLIYILLMTSQINYAQTLRMKVWPGKVPGAIADKDYKEETKMDGSKPRVFKVTDPELLVYLPSKEKANGTAVVICPGGGYGVLAIDHEGYDIAKWFNDMGVAGIILKYRLPSDIIMEDKSVGPLQDVQEAIRIVRRKSKEWNIQPDKIGVMGFSAGGHLAGTASTMYNDKVYSPIDNTSARPDFSILIYGVLSFQQEVTHQGSRNNLLGKNPTAEMVNRFSNELRIDAQTPPAFLVHSGDDGAVPVANSILYYQFLQKHAIPSELHIYEKGGHGYGLAPNGGTESEWPEACKRWMMKHKWIK